MRARVVNGRIVLDEPTTLPEGTVLDLVLEDDGDDLDDADREQRDAALERAWRDAAAGCGRPAHEVLAELRGHATHRDPQP